MIAQEDQPTAVITCNNLLSKGYLQAVCEHTHGKTDLYTHIGLDEIDMMQYLGIPYNCIQRDAYELGRSAAELLMKRIEQPEEAISAHDIEFSVNSSDVLVYKRVIVCYS